MSATKIGPIEAATLVVDGETIGNQSVQARSLIAHGYQYPTSPTPPYASLNWLKGTFNAAAIFGNSDTNTNGGVQLWGGNITGLNEVIYLDCQATGAKFNVSLHVQGRVRGYGWEALDITASNVGIGVSNSGNLPIVTLVKFDAPTDQKIWSIYAASDHLQFNADADSGLNYPWMEVFRTGTTVTQVQIGGILMASDANFQTLEADTATIQTLNATDGEFTTCNVGGSPVVTVDQLPPDYFIYPPAGVVVSTGTAWSASIDPTTIAKWPPAGIPVSKGNSWDTSIDPATVARMNGYNSGYFSFGGEGNATAWFHTIYPTDTYNNYGYALSWHFKGEQELDFISLTNTPATPGGFAWYNVMANQFVPASNYIMRLLGSGELDTLGTIKAGGALVSFGDFTPANPDMTKTNIAIRNWGGYPALTFVRVGSQPADQKYSDILAENDGIHFRFADDALSSYPDWLAVTRTGATATFANFSCPVISAGGLAARGAGVPAHGYQLSLQTNAGTAYIDSWGPNPSTMGAFYFRGCSSDGSITTNFLQSDSVGHVFVPASFQYGIAYRLPAGTDMNTVKTGGMYDLDNPINQPTGINTWVMFRVDVSADNNNFVVQTAWNMTDGSTPQTYVRQCKWGNWTAWYALSMAPA